MRNLLEEAYLCKEMSRIHHDIQRIFSQIMLDITTEENRDTVGPTLLALKHIQDVLLVFKTKGDVLISHELKEK